jgi:hypothetical protein
MQRLAAAIALGVVLAAGIARADVVGGANVRTSFNAWLSPRALPRNAPAPVSLHMRGTITTTNGQEPPQLRRLTVAINRHGSVFMAGLPVCPRQAIRSTTTQQALQRCGPALVGSGHFRADVLIPTQAPLPADGRVLAFNSILDGRHVILAHIYGVDPLPTGSVLTMAFGRRGKGDFGTTMSVEMPNPKADWGHVTGFNLNLHRTYTYRGRRRSLISAYCPAPTGFGGALFAAAKGTYYLADGRTITRVLNSSCKVAG